MPIGDLTKIKSVLDLVAIQDVNLYQIYKKIAFLYKDLLEDLYMHKLEGFATRGKSKIGMLFEEESLWFQISTKGMVPKVSPLYAFSRLHMK